MGGVNRQPDFDCTDLDHSRAEPVVVSVAVDTRYIRCGGLEAAHDRALFAGHTANRQTCQVEDG